jgi:hypothetical protein
MKATILAAAICAAGISHISSASAQYIGPTSSYYGPASMHYHYLSPAGACCALVTVNSGWVFTRNQPVGDVAPYPAVQMPDGSPACEHSNYRPRRSGLCERIW